MTGDVVMVTGDFSPKLGRRESEKENTMGKYDIGVRSDSGEQLKELLVQTCLYPVSTHFKHRRVQTAT